MVSDVSLIPPPLPFHTTLAGRYLDWMRQRAGHAGLRGIFIFTLAEGAGLVEFRTSYAVDVIALMALGLTEEVATSIWHLVATYDPAALLLSLFIDRSDASFSFIRFEI